MRLLDIFGSKAQTRLVEYLLEHRERIFNQAWLARVLSLSPSTIARVVEPLAKNELVRVERVGKQMKVISLNLENPKTALLCEFYDKLKHMD